MNKLILFLFFSSIFSINAETECGEQEFEYYKNKQKIIEVNKTCIEYRKNQPMIYSENCKSGDCEAVKRLLDQGNSMEINPMGSPHFAKCHELGGFPVRVTFKKLISSRKTMICRFEIDDSFLNTEALFLW